jgi:hypothetical protein
MNRCNRLCAKNNVEYLAMKKITPLSIIVTALFFHVLGGAAHATDIGIAAEISRSSIAFEEKDTLVVSLTWDGNPFQYQIDDFPIPTLEKFEILGSSSQVASRPDPTRPGGEVTIRTFRYVLAPTNFGAGVINPLNLTATNRTTNDKQELKTGRLTVEIAKPLPVRKNSLSTLTIIASAGAVFSLGLAGFIVLRKRSARLRAAAQVPEDKPYFDALMDIKKETVADGKLFYSRLYRLLLQYMEKERNLPVSGKTGEEVLAQVGRLEDEQEKAALTGWLTRALEVKYRPDPPPPAEIEDAYAAVRRFFENEVYKR